MAIDMNTIEPLSSKSLLMEQAMRRHQINNNMEFDAPIGGQITEEFKWLNDDKAALQNLVKTMDTSIGQLATQLRDAQRQAERTKKKMEGEQQLLFKQIRALNGLLKKQIQVFDSVERQIDQVEIKSGSLVPQIGIGLMAGLMSAVTILATAPWMTLLMENLRG